MRYRLEWLAFMVALKLVPLLPRRFCFELAGIAGALAAKFDARGRRVALANLECAFGAEFSPERRSQIVRESYQHFARTMLDLFWSPRLNAHNFRRYLEVEGFDQFQAENSRGGGCIFVGLHYSNFEWLSLACGWLDAASWIATEDLKNPLLNSFFEKLRGPSGQRTVPREGALVRLYKVLRKGGRASLLVDMTLPPQQPTVVIRCFGMKTIVTVAHAWLQERTGLPLVPLHTEALPGGRYRIVASPEVQLRPGATHQEIAQACWDVFEPVVRRDPAPWLWMYKYWRYKPAGDTGYPFYAHESPGFEQIASRPNYAKLDRSALRSAEAATGSMR